jgi:class 3 adenylate cyclase/tetratricopeptide (TPR) repeat protein
VTVDSERFLATVLFTDIVGSTERAAEMGDRRWRDVLESHHALIRAELERFRGREINTAGDGFLAAFDDPERAIRCACAIRAAVQALGIEIRSGLHSGEVQVMGEDVGGIAVHIGARVAAKAKAGDVLVSSTVRDLVTGSGLSFEDRGAHVLKGVPGHWRIFAVSNGGTPAIATHTTTGQRAIRRLRPPSRAWRRAITAVTVALALGLAVLYYVIRARDPSPSDEITSPGAAPGIAVLPFSVSGKELDTWREGMVDLLSMDLDGVAGLRAIDSRTVLARWRDHVRSGSVPDLATNLEVARLTGARYALVGSAVSIEGDVRLAAGVYELEGNQALGDARVEGSPDSILGLVDQLSIAVLRAIYRGEERALPRVSLARVTTASLPALKAYLEGEIFFRRLDFENAILAYQRAVEADSTFALAYYRLGSSYAWSETVRSDLAQQSDERAATLAGRLPEREALLVRAALALHRGTLDGLEPLRQAVRRFPEDAEARYLLGDTYYHLGAQALVEPEESERALSKAIELDPSFAPAYIHLIQITFNHNPDSAHAAKLIEAYGQLASGSEFHHRSRLAFALAFGDSAARAQAMQALDTLPARTLLGVARHLWNPRLRHKHEELLLSRLGPDLLEETDLRFGLFWNNLSRGKLRAALEYLDDPQVSAVTRGASLYLVRAMGLPVRAEHLQREVEAGAAGDSQVWSLFYAGATEADRANWVEHARLVTRVREGAQDLRTGGDSTGARVVDGVAEALEGYALWKRGQGEEAMRLLQTAQRHATGQRAPGAINEVVRWWLADLAAELGRFREAERYLRSFWLDPLAAYRLAKVYEQLKDYDKARAAYELFARAWRDADPELQPMVVEARASASRLRGLTRE